MTTYYVNDTIGNDANAGTDQANPKKTIGSAVTAASSDDDVVEITDEATYDDESQIVVAANNITLTHTASALGRPIIDASGLGSTEIINLAPNGSTHRIGFTLNGIEVKGSGNSSQELFKHNNNSANANGLTVTDCFVYEVVALSNQFIQAAAGTSINIKQSAFMFTNSNADAIKFAGTGRFNIENCFLSRSATGTGGESLGPILRSLNSTLNATASFCTFKFEEVGTNIPVIKTFPRVINCVVTGSGANLAGIDAASHTFNVVNVDGNPYQNGSGTSASAGTGDLEGAVTFIDGTSVGHTFSVVQNFALVQGSVGIDQGTSFDSISVDIIGTTRPQRGGFDMGAFELEPPYWTENDGTGSFRRKFGSNGFVIQTTANRTRTTRFKAARDNRQAPFYVTIPGPASIRGRTGPLPGNAPYKNET
tara:strand:- start:118 stop:1386 length:1269 start_codon:yes stop_codon:yes gene_type:complete